LNGTAAAYYFETFKNFMFLQLSNISEISSDVLHTKISGKISTLLRHKQLVGIKVAYSCSIRRCTSLIRNVSASKAATTLKYNGKSAT